MTNKSVEELISNNLYEEAFNEASSYAIGIGRKFHIRGMDRNDIDNETLYSLWTSIISFDSERGVVFTTHLGNCVSNSLMKILNFSKCQKRDEESITIEDLASIFPPQVSDDLDTQLDLHYFLPKILSFRLMHILKEYLKCGSFFDAGKKLGYNFNETRYLRRHLLDTLKKKWIDDGKREVT